MLRRSFVLPVLLTALVALAGCKTSEPVVQKVQARPLQPSAGEKVVVDQLLIVVDASGSLDSDQMFYEERALVESFVSASPDGSYDAGAVAFGGSQRHEIPLTRFDRGRLESDASQLPYLESGTPVHKVLGESAQTLGASKGRAAVVVFSDGMFTDEFGRDVEIERVLAAAGQVVESHDGPVCFHTVQVGTSAAGAANLRRLSEVTSCGSARSASAIGNESQLHAFNRAVFLRATPVAATKSTLPPVSAPAPQKASAPMQTNWSVNFGLDSAQISSSYDSQFSEIAAALQAHPNSRLVLSGHTDTSGNAEHNRRLSVRRAEATRDGLIAAGVDPQRIEVQGFGADSLRYPETSDTNRAANRRTEIELVR